MANAPNILTDFSRKDYDPVDKAIVTAVAFMLAYQTALADWAKMHEITDYFAATQSVQDNVVKLLTGESLLDGKIQLTEDNKATEVALEAFNHIMDVVLEKQEQKRATVQ